MGGSERGRGCEALTYSTPCSNVDALENLLRKLLLSLIKTLY